MVGDLKTVTAMIPSAGWSTLRRTLQKHGGGLMVSPQPPTDGEMVPLILSETDMHTVIAALHRNGQRNPITWESEDLDSENPETVANAMEAALLNESDEKNHYRCRLLANILKLETVLQTGTTRYRPGEDWGCTADPCMYWDDRHKQPLSRRWI